MNDFGRQDEYDDDNEVETSFRDDMEFHQYINKYFEQLENLSPEDQRTHKRKIIKQMVKRFYKVNDELYLNKDHENFFLGGDDNGRINLYVRDRTGNEFKLTWYEGGVLKFYKFRTLKGKYGVNFIRSVLGVEHYNITNQHINEVENRLESLNQESIFSNEITSEQEAEEFLETASNAETSVTSIIDDETFKREAERRFNLPWREIVVLPKKFTNMKEALANNIAELDKVNKKIEEKKKELRLAILEKKR